MTHEILMTQHLSCAFGGVWANRDINFSLFAGEIHALLGANGAGKSTFINLLSGVLSPTTGDIYFHGKNINAFDEVSRSRMGIGRSFQRSSLFPTLTARQHFQLASQNVFYEELLHAIGELDGVFEVDLDSPICQLNHGAQRWVEIMMVLVSQASIWLLDEPFAGLGQEETKKMVELLQRLMIIRPKVAILLVEHDVSAVIALAHRYSVLLEGRMGASEVIEQGRTPFIHY